jgi:ABC-2 type transport system permease protein
MTSLAATVNGRIGLAAGELAKLPAFLRRDFLIAWSYRVPFFTDAIALAIQALLFYFVGLLVDQSKLPTYGGSSVTYMEFAAFGIALAAFVQLGLGRVAAAMRKEQLTGTLESLLMTPTAPSTIQLGSVFYDLVYIPIRTGVFLVAVAIAFGLDFEPSGIAPAAAVLVVFIPFVWGLGLVSAAGMVTFRAGGAALGFMVTVLTLGSGAYFPLELLPNWVTTVAVLNPMALAIEGMREAMLGGGGWSAAGPSLIALLPLSILSLGLGAAFFRRALRREQGRGTLGLY